MGPNFQKSQILENFSACTRNTATNYYNELLNELKETFINGKGDHHIYHQ